MNNSTNTLESSPLLGVSIFNPKLDCRAWITRVSDNGLVWGTANRLSNDALTLCGSWQSLQDKGWILED